MKKLVKNLISIIIAIIIVLLIQAFVITGIVVHKQGMSPTLSTGDRLIVNKVAPLIKQLDNGDIVMYRQNDKVNVSRIIGVTGDSIAYKKGTLYKDDRQIKEPYANNRIDALTLRKIKGSESDIVPPNSYFVLNDQRQHDADSRNYGFIQQKDIVGKVALKYYPLDEFTVNFK